jgi:hypothetical protein
MYAQVFHQFDNMETYAERLISYIDPSVQDLQTKKPSRAMLDQITKSQTSPWPYDVGYLDYVTDDRLESYFRPYVGQTINSKRRMTDHAHSIVGGNYETLQYYIL